MDIHQLPKTVLIDVFGYLPFKSQISIGRVSRRFHEISKAVVSRIKVLNLVDPIFKKLTPDQLAVLFDCQDSVLSISLNRGWAAHVLAGYSCSRLKNIDLGMANVDNVDCGALIERNPNLKSFMCKNVLLTEFPDVVCARLETLKIPHLTSRASDLVPSILGRVPNLKHLHTSIDTLYGAFNPPNIDHLLATVLKLETLELSVRCSMDLWLPLVHFWNLSSLKHLSIRGQYGSISSNILKKISTSFLHLELLSLEGRSPPDIGPNDIVALNSMENLQVLRIGNVEMTGNNQDQVLDRNGRLRELVLPRCMIPPNLFILLFRSNPDLRELEINDVDFSQGPPQNYVAAMMGLLRNLHGIGSRRVSIRFHTDMSGSIDQWQSDGVKEVVDELKEAEDIELDMIFTV